MLFIGKRKTFSGYLTHKMNYLRKYTIWCQIYGLMAEMGKKGKSTEKREVEALLGVIYLQIKNYPTPIAGCDEQFNFLLAERDRLRDELEQLKRSL